MDVPNTIIWITLILKKTLKCDHFQSGSAAVKRDFYLRRRLSVINVEIIIQPESFTLSVTNMCFVSVCSGLTELKRRSVIFDDNCSNHNKFPYLPP